MTREKIISTMLCAAMVFSLAAGLSGAASADAVDTPPYPNVEFGYTETVTPGTIRYTSQNPKSDCFYAAYWNNDASLAQHQCLAACLSMDLSYVGVDATPGYILSQNGGVARPAYGWGGSKYISTSFDTAMQNYMGGAGDYSPPIIHLNSYSSGGHYVLVIGKVSDTVYRVADPYDDDLWLITISGTSVSYNYYGTPKTDVIDGAIQYFKDNGGVAVVQPSPEPSASPEPEPSPAPVVKGLEFVIGSKSYTDNGVKTAMDVAPYIKNSRTYLPARFVCEALGADVEWDQGTKTVTITKGGTVIKLTVNSVAASVNGQPETLATAPEITDGRTCLPIRYVAQTLGATVGWVQSTRTVTITMGE
jgi:hypothetical protein